MEGVERWGGREQLWLAAAVARGGGWGAVSRALRSCGAPAERCGARGCARQYAALQARRPSASPHALLHQLTRDRCHQLQSLMAEEARVHAKLRDEVRELLSVGISEGRVRSLAAAVDAEQLARARHPHHHPPRPRPRASPLLTSLLQSAPAPAPTPQHDLDKIEQIKSELQQIERALIDGESSSVSEVLDVIPKVPEGPAKHPEKVDIDDIEIKAEDVYAFSDIDLDIPPVSSIHKSIGRPMSSDKNLFNRKEAATDVGGSSDVATSPSGRDDDEQTIENLKTESQLENQTTAPETAADISPSIPPETKDPVDDAANFVAEIGSETTASKPDLENAKSLGGDEDDSDGEMNRKVSEIKKDLDAKKTESVSDGGSETKLDETVVSEIDPSKENVVDPTNAEAPAVDADLESAEPTESRVETDDDAPIEVIKEDKPGKTKRDYSRKKTERDDPTSPSTESDGAVQSKVEFGDEIGSDNSQEPIDKRLVGKIFGIEPSGSRSDSPSVSTDSLPNSPAPATPPSSATRNATNSTSEREKDHRIWKKSVTLALNRLYALKYASLFVRPITDEQAPNYSIAVKKPMDLSTIRRNIDSGAIKTTQEFQHAVLLMLTNALMYNRTDHRVYSMAHDTIEEAISQLNVLLQAQAHPASTPTMSRLTRPPRPGSRSAGPPVKRKRGGGGNETPTGKKRKTDDP